VAVNLAIALAEAGTPVALVDADLRRPSIAPMLGLAGEAGLTDVLIGKAGIGDVIQRSGSTGKLWVLTSGSLPPNPSELLGSKQMRTALEELARVTTVIVDAPPLLPVTDAAVLAAQTDGAILVTALGRTRRDQVRTAVTRLEVVGSRVLGVVANRASTRGGEGYAYAYGYGYAAKGRHKNDEPEGPVLDLFPPAASAAASADGHGNGHRNGTANGSTNGTANGSVNGSANGHGAAAPGSRPRVES
jgi:capsular exopolysaccharide synthesis family protein